MFDCFPAGAMDMGCMWCMDIGKEQCMDLDDNIMQMFDSMPSSFSDCPFT